MWPGRSGGSPRNIAPATSGSRTARGATETLRAAPSRRRGYWGASGSAAWGGRGITIAGPVTWLGELPTAAAIVSGRRYAPWVNSVSCSSCTRGGASANRGGVRKPRGTGAEIREEGGQLGAGPLDRIVHRSGVGAVHPVDQQPVHQHRPVVLPAEVQVVNAGPRHDGAVAPHDVAVSPGV